MKNYNAAALRGEEITDAEHAQALGLNVPADILNTPKYNDYVLDRVYEQNVEHFQTEINPDTSQKYTPEEAQAKASVFRDKAKANIAGLIRKD
jgi:hypothetical protein